MKPWHERASEVANNLAPPFLAMVLHEVARGHHEQAEAPLPYELAFLAAPVALHSEARRALPRTTGALMPTWLQKNAPLRARLVDRACSMTDLVREGLLWGGTHSVVTVDASGIVAQRKTAVRRYVRGSTAEVQEVAKKAHFLGKWFAKAGTPATVMVLWGVRV